MTFELDIRLSTDFASSLVGEPQVAVLGIGGGTLVRPEVGWTVTLFDGEGHSCQGTVVDVDEVDGDIVVFVDADFSTWVDNSDDMTSDLAEVVRQSLLRSANVTGKDEYPEGTTLPPELVTA